MSDETDTLLGLPDDPRLIRGIYNYCNRWCDRCPFTDRCAVFQETQRDEAAPQDDRPFEQLRASFQQTIELLKEWCVRERIDFTQIQDDARSDTTRDAMRRTGETIDADPLSVQARKYFMNAAEIVSAVVRASEFHTWNTAIQSAIETIGWHSAFIGAKIHRALHGVVNALEDLEQDPVQNDANGSAKAARVAIAESRRAWASVLEEGAAPADSPLRRIVDLLDQIDAGVAERFPAAMQFVRPGFDEPEVAAGALTSLESLEPRPRLLPHPRDGDRRSYNRS